MPENSIWGGGGHQRQLAMYNNNLFNVPKFLNISNKRVLTDATIASGNRLVCPPKKIILKWAVLTG